MWGVNAYPSSNYSQQKIIAAAQSTSTEITAGDRSEFLEASMNREMEVLYEDFSLVPDGHTATTGNIGERYTDLLASHSQAPGRFIDSAYTPGSGTWEGDYVYAGKNGTLIIQPVSGQAGGMLRTPLGDYSGDITVTVRLRAAKVFWLQDEETYITSSGSNMTMSLGIGGYDSKDYPFTDIGDYPSYTTPMIYENDGWQTFTFTFRNEGSDNDGFISFYTRYAVEIDWIKITDAATFLASPAIKPATDFTNDGFTINWHSVRRSYNYFIDLWTSDYLSDEDFNVSYDFEDGKLPAGATVDGGTVEEGIGKDNSYAARISKDGEAGAFNFPEAPVKLKTMSFSVKFDMDDEDYEPQVMIDGLTEEGWRPLAELDYDGFVVKAGKWYDINIDKESVADKYTSIRLYALDLGEGNSVIIDNVVFTGGRPFGLVRVNGEYSAVNDPDNDNYDYNYYDFTPDWRSSSYTFTGLDPEKEYYYRVRSHNVKNFSVSSKNHAFGVATPELVAPTEIETASYTALWNDVAKAQNYTVRNFASWLAEDDIPEAVIFNEAFGKSSGEGNTLVALNNYSPCSLDEYTDMPGWTGVCNSVGQNMIGCADSYGYIMSPMLMVNPDHEKYYLYIEAKGKPQDILSIRFTESGQFADIAFEANGRISGTIEVPKTICGEKIKFSATKGFALTAIEISQEVVKNELVRTFHSEVSVPAGISKYTFDNLEPGRIYSYDVIANYTFEDKSVSSKSKHGEYMMVDLSKGNAQTVSEMEIETLPADELLRYDINGMQVDSSYKGLVIIRLSDGSVRKVFVK